MRFQGFLALRVLLEPLGPRELLGRLELLVRLGLQELQGPQEQMDRLGRQESPDPLAQWAARVRPGHRGRLVQPVPPGSVDRSVSPASVAVEE